LLVVLNKVAFKVLLAISVQGAEDCLWYPQYTSRCR